MSRQVRYGDQIFIEISDLKPFPSTEIRLLCSSGFLGEGIYAVKTSNYHKACFRNCIFTILPSLVDSKEDLDTLQSLKSEVSLLSLNKPQTIGEKYLNKEIDSKQEQIVANRDTIDALNKKILSEMDNQIVYYGDVVLLQHLESGYYLTAEPSYHPHNRSLYNLKLQKASTSSCYFRFYSYSSQDDRSAVDFESEMKLFSVPLNSVVSMSDMGINNEKLERQENAEFIKNFPIDSIQRENAIKSFDSHLFAVGTALDSTDNNKIRLAEYCCRDEIISFNKRKVIKNGDYVRFHLEDFYLTASKSKYRENIGLFQHKSEDYKYSLTNTIFQLVLANQPADDYPRGSEIMTNSRKVDNEDNIEAYYIKHFMTGYFLSAPGDGLYDGPPNDQGIASFQLVNRHLMNQKLALTQNKRTALKVFRENNKPSQFYLESEVEKYQVLESDNINSLYYIGFQHPEDKIKSKIKLVKKSLTGNEDVGSYMKVSLVGDEEMKKIAQFESYANALKKFLQKLPSRFEQGKKEKKPFFFAGELKKVMEYSESLSDLMSNSSFKGQILAQEFKILDIACRFLYYFFIGDDVYSLLLEGTFNMRDIINFLKSLSKIILKATEANELTHAYASQYIRVFILSLLSCSGLFYRCNKQESDELKHQIVHLLYRFLSEKDYNTLQQLIRYETLLFSKLDEHSDYSVHLLKLMTHFFGIKAPALKNTLRDNFIDEYLGDEGKVKKIFPKLRYIPEQQDFEIEFQRKSYDPKIMLTTAPQEVQHYVTCVFRLIASIAEARSIKFWRVIISYYDEQLCEFLVTSSKVPAELKNVILEVLDLVHLAYNKLPFDSISPQIQIILSSDRLKVFEKNFEEKINEANRNLVGDLENNILNQITVRSLTSQKIIITKRPSIQTLYMEILGTGLESFNQANARSLAFTLQVIKNILKEESQLNYQSLCTIHDFLVGIIQKGAEYISKDFEDKKLFVSNADAIYAILEKVDNHMARIAFKESMNQVKDKFLKEVKFLKADAAKFRFGRKQNTNTNNNTGGNIPVGGGSSLNSLDSEVIDSLQRAISQDWKSRTKLYELANKTKKNYNVEEQLLKDLIKIIKYSDVGLASKTINLVKHKTNYEMGIIKESLNCVILYDQTEISTFLDLVSSLLVLHQIGRRIQVKVEFKRTEKEDNNTLDQIIQNLENIFMIIYDFDMHMFDESSDLATQLAKHIFLQRFKYSKVQADNEILFTYKPSCIRTSYQQILNILQSYKILVPFIKYLLDTNLFTDVPGERLKYGSRLVMVILILFMHKKPINQMVMSKYAEFILLFNNSKILNSSIEVPAMFIEMCRENKRLLSLNEDYLRDIVSKLFIPHFIKRNQYANEEGSLPVDYLKSIPVILTADIPKDMFDPSELMTRSMMDLSKSLTNYTGMSLYNIIAIKNILVQTKEKDPAVIDLEELVPPIPNKVFIEMPKFYTVVRELLEAQISFAITKVKERVLILQSCFTIEQIKLFIRNCNIEFNFGLKRLLLQMTENLYFRNNYNNTNMFSDYQQFVSFVSVFLVDAYYYLKAKPGFFDPTIDLDILDHFATVENKAYLDKYNELIKTELSNIVFFEYQSVVIFRKVWTEYIYYVLCDFFKNIISHFKEYMLLDKEKRGSYQTIFHVWFKLMIKLREMDTDEKLQARINSALKSAVVHSEYSKYREKIYLVSRPKLSKGGNPNEDLLTSQELVKKLDIDQILHKYWGDKSQYKNKYVEENLANLVADLDKEAVKKLCKLLVVQGTTAKDIIFILRVLRKFIEVENKETVENRNRPIFLWDDMSLLEIKKINRKQELLAEANIIESIFHLLTEYENNKIIMTEVLLLSIGLLFSGNRNIQTLFYEQFKLDIESDVFQNIYYLLEETIEAFFKEGKEKTNISYFKAVRFAFHFLSQHSSETTYNPDMTDIPENLKKELELEYQLKFTKNRIPRTNMVVISKFSDHTVLLIILEFLQCLCEGHFLQFQEFLRDQTVVQHTRSYNILEFLCQGFHIYSKHVNLKNLDIGIKILDVLIEMEQGESQSNIKFLLHKTFISDICNTLVGYNSDLDLLARGFGFDPNHPEFMKLKLRALVILKDLVERSEFEDLKEIRQYLDLRALVTSLKENIIAFHRIKKGYPKQKMINEDDIWEPNLSCAFMIYTILKHLSFEDRMDEFSREMKQVIQEIFENGKGLSPQEANRYLNTFFKKYTGSIEIENKSSRLMRIYFPIPVTFFYLKDDTKQEFSDKVDRSNTQTKIAGLIDSSVELIAQMRTEYKSRKRLLGINIYDFYVWVRLLTNVFAFAVNAFNLFRLEADEDNINYTDEELDKQIQNILNSCQSAIAVVLIFLWLKTRLARYLAFKWDSFVHHNVQQLGELSSDIIQKLGKDENIDYATGKMILLLKGPYSEEWKSLKSAIKKILFYYNLVFTFQCPSFIWLLVYVGICIGSNFHPLVASFQLFDIVIRSDTIHRIWLAVSRNSRQFIWTLVFLMITVYVYSLLALFFIRERYSEGDNGIQDFCPDAYACYLANLNFGLRGGGGVADTIKKVQYQIDERGTYFLETLFDLSFFIIIIILLLNLIFGMIIDAFGELRDEKNRNDDDKKNTCFICGLPRAEYERTASFDKHITEEHNMWQYVAYIVYLEGKHRKFPTDLTDTENYVLDRCNKRDTDWIPVGRSLTLERYLEIEEKQKKTEVDKLREDVLGAITKVAEQNQKMIEQAEQANLNQVAKSKYSTQRSTGLRMDEIIKSKQELPVKSRNYFG